MNVALRTPRSVDIGWQTPYFGPDFAHARIFLTSHPQPSVRAYLGVVDAGRHTRVDIPDTMPEGTYVIDVETYSSASWGGGRLSGLGTSAPFAV